MEDAILLGQLIVKCRFAYQAILSCYMYAKYGEMTRVRITCTVKFEETQNILSQMREEPLELLSRGGDGRQESLFSGLIDGASLKNEGDYAVLTLTAVSCIWKMDIQKKSRSFQDISRTYRNIAEEVAGEYSFTVRWNAPDKKPACPLIQYEETDYQFIRRIASHIGCRLLPEDYGERKAVNIGIGERSPRPINIERYGHDMLLYKKDGQKLEKERIIGYRIRGGELLRVGDCAEIQGVKYCVMECGITFKNDSIEADVSLYPPKCFEADRLPADTLTGVVIEGTVLRTEGETLRLHLDIDEEQEESKAYDYPWRPITGNMFYCMPEKGTKVALYFSKSDEQDAAAVYNLRENGVTCGELADYNDRYFTTNHEKRLYMKPGEMGFVHGEGENAKITLSDESMLQMKTANKMSIMAEGQVQLKAKSVTMTAPKEATLVRKDISNPTVINMCNAFDAIGCTGKFAAPPQMTGKKKRTAVRTGGLRQPERETEKYSLKGMVGDILANIPTVETEDSVLEAAAGSMPLICALRVKPENG